MRSAWLAIVLLTPALLACHERPPDISARLSVPEALGSSGAAGDAGFARAAAPRAFQFPADHGPHPDFRTEWWYYTGNLATADGRGFGFQLTFFRRALTPRAPDRPSPWATNQIYLAHFALSDLGDGSFRSFERTTRGALGLAGARGLPFHVWLDSWSAAASGSEATPMRLRAAAGSPAVAVDLSLEQGKPPVLEGDHGLSRKGAEPGQASYYYSLTRMPAAGTIQVGARSFAVRGLSWMDREWSTGSLGRDQAGWDWFALQLDDGRDLMLYRLRRRDGGADPASAGTLIDRAGGSRPLAWSEVRLTVLDCWTSPRSGASYPSRWRLAVPALGLDLDVRPALADQELDTSFRYWEGAVTVAGTSRGAPAGGRGYVELTGYAENGAR